MEVDTSTAVKFCLACRACYRFECGRMNYIGEKKLVSYSAFMVVSRKKEQKRVQSDKIMTSDNWPLARPKYNQAMSYY